MFYFSVSLIGLMQKFTRRDQANTWEAELAGVQVIIPLCDIQKSTRGIMSPIYILCASFLLWLLQEKYTG